MTVASLQKNKSDMTVASLQKNNNSYDSGQSTEKQ